MYLMHHYTAFTSKELSQSDAITHLWQHEALDLAVKHPFLMHGLLAISALHLASKEPESAKEFLPLSIHHQNLAISAFRSQLSHINEGNCHALFAQAAVVSISSKVFSCIKSRGNPHLLPPLDDIIEPYMLTRGVGEVVGTARQWIQKGPMAPMLYGHTVLKADHFKLSPSTQSHFENLRAHFQKTVNDGKDRASLLEATSMLESIYREVSLWKQEVIHNPGTIWKWPNMTPLKYMLMLRQHHPQALLLYAHFVMLSHVHNTYWYFKDWESQALTVIAAALPAEIQPMIQYPDFLREKATP
jgi:hypothetical protein